MDPLASLWRWTRGHWRAIDADNPQPTTGFDVRVLIVLIVVAVSLTLQEYVGQRDTFMRLWPGDPGDRVWHLQAFAWWTGWRVGGYLVLPALVVVFMPGERLRDYYISPRGFFRRLWIYLTLLLLVSPMVIIAATTKGFQLQYPFYKWANHSVYDLVAWELMYAAQFVSLEFFFRGFMLQALRRRFGSNAIFVMIVPYCMIHYGKPMAETFGAIGAGLILGTLAMRTRSIWGGVLIHVGVALSMDLLALGHCPPASSGRPCSG